eukprot:GHVQ01033174.1.p1 GENE.GHVQ01033174.1~~GHVQ01033174.1.p1  ORF type:complete len:736 (+),score=146.46 GHVQ01033174.1:112-2319(+)
MRQRHPPTGASPPTQVESPLVASETIPPRSSTPILRLHVDRQTGAVLRLPEPNTESTTSEESSEFADDKTGRGSFVLKASKTTATVVEHEEYTEVYDANEAGLSWGEKRSRDGSWQEKWMQQKQSDDEGEQTIFGRNAGYNAELRQRWTETWRHSGDDQVEIEKECEELDAEGNVIKKWTEENRQDKEKFHKQKEGWESDGSKSWKEVEHSGADADEADAHEVKSVHLREDTTGSITKTTKRSCLRDGSEHTVETYCDELEEWQDEWHDMKEGVKCGMKSGTNKSGIKWNEKWREEEGRREIEKWAVSQDGKHLWGEKKIWKDESEQETVERWEKWISTEELRISVEVHNEKTKDSASSGTDKDKWGERTEDIQRFDSDGQKQLLSSTQVRTEKWYDNGEEYVTDRVNTSTKYQPTSSQAKAIEQVKRVSQSGDRYSDGTKWGSELAKTSEPSSDQELALQSMYSEKWWVETSGNKWGEKEYEELDQEGQKQLQCHEEWYDNGTEKQTDRWEIKPDMSKDGEKFGERDNVRWREKWSTDSKGDRQVHDKSWTEIKDGESHEWGERSGREQGRQWLNKWGKTECHDRTAGREWQSSWDEKGEEETKTEEESKEWRYSPHGDLEVTSWFKNRFGVHGDEKWADKQGHNEEGDVWSEKWNETPDKKRAEKTGRNARGDEWREAWKEEIDKSFKQRSTWAEKTGKNAQVTHNRNSDEMERLAIHVIHCDGTTSNTCHTL